MEEKEKLDYRKLIDEIKPKFESHFLSFKEELNKLRVARANPALVEDILVDLYGKKYPLKQLGTVSVSPPRDIIIQPWDNSYLEPIKKAIESAGLDLNPILEQTQIRIPLPPMTEEYRKNLLKTLSQKKENLRKILREIREDAWRKIQNAFLEKRLSEDEKYKAKEALQDLIDEYNEKIEEVIEKKEKEIQE